MLVVGVMTVVGVIAVNEIHHRWMKFALRMKFASQMKFSAKAESDGTMDTHGHRRDKNKKGLRL